MRIQHNIPAMSAYRNYTNNVSAVAKNLEKLSSGYKINRAGDDAAGLAISEKMRAQISGLEQAQNNAKSGINLVQTAEGALTEVHDMLNRMVTLAEQSANGTYDNDVDRVQLQKEVSQLRSEIDRIADSANFNGIKLLDGSLNAIDSVTVNDATIKGLSTIDALVDRMANKMDTDTAYDAVVAGGATDFRHADASQSGKTSFSIDSQNGGWTVKKGTVKVQLELYTTNDKTMNDKQVVDTGKQTVDINIAEDGTLSMKDALAKFMENLDVNENGQKVITLNMPGKDDGAQVGIEYAVTMEGDELKFQMTDKGYATAAANSKDSTDVSRFDGSFNVILTAWQNKTTGAAGTAVDAVAYAAKSADEKAASDRVASYGLADCSTNDVTTGRAYSAERLAETMIRFIAGGDNGKALDPNVIKDGAGFQIGGTNYVWGGTDETVNGKFGDNVKVVDIRDLCDKDGKLITTKENGTLNKYLTEALSRFTDVAADNEMWSVQVTQNGDALVFTERDDNPSDADLTTITGIKQQIKSFGAIEANVDTVKATGKALTLQIGDTAESFNKLDVNVKDMHAAAMGIGDIDISTQEGAAAAMEKIKNAINYVSDARGDLGATQNRLDHTINNLSVMQENIQDAESTIRDVDIAKEMMAYTKNNILVQSAQAMLAQANQLPQGVLQLLG